jgi:D-alanine--poly(phosphoribitol) ligase subunit 2
MKEQVRKFIAENFSLSGRDIGDDESLFESGIVDSLGFIQLLTFIEKTFNVSLDMSEITLEKFSTVNEIVETVKSKMRK